MLIKKFFAIVSVACFLFGNVICMESNPVTEESEYFKKVILSKEQKESILENLEKCSGHYILYLRSNLSDGKRFAFAFAESALRILGDGGIILSDENFVREYKYDSGDPSKVREKFMDADRFYENITTDGEDKDDIMNYLQESRIDLAALKLYLRSAQMTIQIKTDLKKIKRKMEFFVVNPKIINNKKTYESFACTYMPIKRKEDFLVYMLTQNPYDVSKNALTLPYFESYDHIPYIFKERENGFACNEDHEW